MNTLVIGGTRSGKSRFAQRLALSRSGSPVYVATSRAWDDDHTARIARHRAERGPEWTTIEEETAIGSLQLDGRVAVVDCLTLWLTNILVNCQQDSERTLAQARDELDRAVARSTTWIFVTNEIGQGVHAPTAVGRAFADLQGFVNQHAAALTRTVVMMVAGIPLVVKGELDLPG